MLVDHRTLPPSPPWQVGWRRKIGKPRVAKGPKPRSALSAASTPVRGALIAFMAATDCQPHNRFKKEVRAGFPLPHLVDFCPQVLSSRLALVTRVCPVASVHQAEGGMPMNSRLTSAPF